MSIYDSTSSLIDLALKEDIGSGDVTSEYFVNKTSMAAGYILVKQDGIVAGYDVVTEVLKRVDPSITLEILVTEGSKVPSNTRVMKLQGKARAILTAERTALNFMQRLSGIATKTSSYAELISHTKAKLLDTRKTTPGWRFLEKKAVIIGGGNNHRMGLYDRAMVKDNHLVTQDDYNKLQDAINKLKAEKPHVEIELETDTLEQVEKFLTLKGVNHILLDNMSCDLLKKAVIMRGKTDVFLEASGGVTHHTIKEMAETGVDYISVGALTHSAVALDISLEFVPIHS